MFDKFTLILSCDILDNHIFTTYAANLTIRRRFINIYLDIQHIYKQTKVYTFT